MFRVRFVLPLSACHVGFVPAVFRVQFVDIEISDTPLWWGQSWRGERALDGRLGVRDLGHALAVLPQRTGDALPPGQARGWDVRQHVVVGSRS